LIQSNFSIFSNSGIFFFRNQPFKITWKIITFFVLFINAHLLLYTLSFFSKLIKKLDKVYKFFNKFQTEGSKMFRLYLIRPF